MKKVYSLIQIIGLIDVNQSCNAETGQQEASWESWLSYLAVRLS